MFSRASAFAPAWAALLALGCGNRMTASEPGPSPAVGRGVCAPTGCSNQLCADSTMVTSCVSRPEYACYRSATCERQSDGNCGWTQTSALTGCIAATRTPYDAGMGGYTDAGAASADASGGLSDASASRDAATTVDAGLPPVDSGRPDASPGLDASPVTPDASPVTPDAGALDAGAPPDATAESCRRTGCSGQLCADEDIVTTCEFRAEYACYRNATCTRQSDGLCGWTQTAELQACLANPGGN